MKKLASKKFEGVNRECWDNWTNVATNNEAEQKNDDWQKQLEHWCESWWPPFLFVAIAIAIRALRSTHFSMATLSWLLSTGLSLWSEMFKKMWRLLFMAWKSFLILLFRLFIILGLIIMRLWLWQRRPRNKRGEERTNDVEKKKTKIK